MVAPSPAQRLRRRASGVVAFAAAVGLVSMLALPAYAGVHEAPEYAGGAAIDSAQGLDIAAGEAPALKERDSYTGIAGQPTAEQMAAAYRLAGGQIVWPAVDDYPFKDDPNVEAQSSMNYSIRTCTDFVAWRLNRDAGSFGAPWLMDWSYLTPNGGDGQQWAAAWLAHGWPTSTIPVAGAVAWFGYGMNHVAYVNSVEPRRHDRARGVQLDPLRLSADGHPGVLDPAVPVPAAAAVVFPGGQVPRSGVSRPSPINSIACLCSSVDRAPPS